MFVKRGLILLVLVLTMVPFANSALREASLDEDIPISSTSNPFICGDSTEIGNCNAENLFCGNNNIIQNGGFERGSDLPYNYKKDPNNRSV